MPRIGTSQRTNVDLKFRGHAISLSRLQRLFEGTLICTPHGEFRTMLTIQCVTSDVGMESGAGWGTRTPDLMITNQLLYQLS